MRVHADLQKHLSGYGIVFDSKLLEDEPLKYYLLKESASVTSYLLHCHFINSE